MVVSDPAVHGIRRARDGTGALRVQQSSGPAYDRDGPDCFHVGTVLDIEHGDPESLQGAGAPGSV